MNFYERFLNLCEAKGVKPGRAAEDCGINRSNVTMWKQTGGTPRYAALQRLADYFDVTTDQLLGAGETKKAPTEKAERSVSDEEIKFALFGGDGEITDAMYEEVKRFAAFVKQREAEKKE